MMKNIILILVLFANANVTFGQYINLKVRIDNLNWSGFDDENDGNESRLRFSLIDLGVSTYSPAPGQGHGIGPGYDDFTYSKDYSNAGGGSSDNITAPLAPISDKPYFSLYNCSTNLIWKYQGWDEDDDAPEWECNSGDDPCPEPNSGVLPDAFKQNANPYLSENPPERYYIFHNVLSGGTGNVTLGGLFLAKFNFPEINAPKFDIKNGVVFNPTAPPIICPSDSIRISTNFQVWKKGSFTDKLPGNLEGVKFVWSAKLGNGPWITKHTSSATYTTFDSTFSFKPLTIFPEFDTLKSQSTISFQVMAIGEEGNSNNSPTSVFTVMPKAPIATVTSSDACPGKDDGKVLLNFISGIGTSYRYFLRAGFNVNSGCNPDSISGPSACFNGQKGYYPDVKPTSFIDSLKPVGQYTAWIANEGGLKGSCFSYYNVEVKQLPVLKITMDSSVNVSCKDGIDGGVFLHSNNATPSYVISPLFNSTTASYSVQDTVFKVQNLSKGMYIISVKDFCNVLAPPDTVFITEPTRLTGNIIQSISPTCVSPANGKITAEADSGSGSYNYYWYKAGIVIDSLMNTTLKTHTIFGLDEGTYKVDIRDAVRPTCAGYTTFINLSYPTSMSLTDSIVNLSCYQSGNGQIFLTGDGNASGYKYALYSNPTSTLSNNTSGIFSNLSMGDYREILTRNLPGCFDSVSRDSIFVSQPTPMSSALTSKNVSCIGKDDGFVNVFPNGGTPGYTYLWEFKDNNTWLQIPSATTAYLTDLYPALYKVKIWDANGCNIYSDSVDVREPGALQFDSLITKNIVCFGETGKILGYGSGGTAPYLYTYSLNNSPNYVVFDSATGLYSGNYKIKLTDTNLCAVIYPLIQKINTPSQPLKIDYQVSDFNGYSVSCKNSKNGTINVTPTGGNMFGYTGYKFSIDNSIYRDSIVYKNLAVGTYNMKLKDGRGCIVMNDITLTEPDQLNVSIASIDTLKCGNDTNGIITVSNVGGTSPFFGRKIGTAVYQEGTIFTNLDLSSFTFEIKDINGCKDTISSTMVSKHPKLLYDFISENAKCFNGNSGKIQVTPSGGLAPYQYTWANSSLGTSNILNDLKIGNYTFEIKDAANCLKGGLIMIDQPDSLTFTVDKVPVCPNTTSGELRIKVLGGTSPYLYSLDSLTYDTNRIIKNVSPDIEYTITVKDSNNCFAQDKASVITFSDTIKADFMMVSNDYTSDTIIAVDITSPKPDSIQWTFSAGVNVVSQNNAIAAVQYTDAGTNTITMRTFNKLCEYVVTKNISIKIKDTTFFGQGDTSKIDSFTVNPNPTTGICNLYVSATKVYPFLFLQVANNNGEDVFTKKYYDIKIVEDILDLTSLAKGSYFLKVFVENDYKVKVIIIE